MGKYFSGWPQSYLRYLSVYFAAGKRWSKGIRVNFSAASIRLAFVVCVAACLLSACSDARPTAIDGSGDPPPPPPPPEPFTATDCAVLDALPSGQRCKVTAGNAQTLVSGNVLTPGMVFVGGGVLVDEAGVIACAGCGCDGSAAGATVIECPGAAISPGLINSHDHLNYVNHRPAAATGERYEHRHDWRVGVRGHTEIPVGETADAEQSQWGELRFLVGGATSTVGQGRFPIPGLLRNLDGESGLSGVPEQVSEPVAPDYPRVFNDVFPLGDSAGIQRAGDCDYNGDGAKVTSAEELLLNGYAYLPHVAEGIDTEARNEFLCLSNPIFDFTPLGPPSPPDTTIPGISRVLTTPLAGFIHGTGLIAADFALMAQTQTALIWAPRSNVSLYGQTADVTAADRLGVTIALSTDWIISGSMNLQRELACADQLNRNYYDNHFSAEALWKMVTANAAVATRSDDLLGTLEADKLGDITVYAADATESPYRVVVSATLQDVLLVMRGGKVLYGEAPLVAALGDGCETLDVCGAAKRICVADEIGGSFAALSTKMAAEYPLFSCGVPENEPSCAPGRTVSVNGSTVFTGARTIADPDGDGITGTADNCPNLFNPIRPVDDGVQADSDGDGTGDACDDSPASFP